MLLVISYTRAFNFEPKSKLARDLGDRNTISECARGTSEDVRLEGGEDEGFAYEEYGNKII